MDPSLEETILRLAVSRGILGESALDRLDDGADPSQESRLARIVEAGLLDEPTLAILRHEARQNDVGGPWSVRSWSRYRFLGAAGSGAMGRVYKAFDPELDRVVALKFLHGHSPEMIERFRREAHAQARVDHPNICKVYEVGEVEGDHYIAMQFIDGESLAVAAKRMTVEEKLKVVKEVAEALQEAHRVGLIHRDVKPGNIMVEHTSDGGWRPSVVDFGLARVEESAGMTVSGQLLGTPAYMSPEQARGDHSVVDRRSDVYSLGATLYVLLTERPPFEGSEIPRKVQEDVPKGPRDIRPGIPRDVESIVMKCLQKRPENRYGSARALAEDLGRYLDGEPVRARPVTRRYRWRMRIAKHRVEFVTAGIGAFLLLVALVWGVHQRIQSERVSRVAQAFGQRVERIDSIARNAALVPLHDATPAKNLIREDLAVIERQMGEMGSRALGPGHYALGRGYLALEAYDEARFHVEQAWAAGYREPEQAYVLGLVMGELYLRALREADRIPGAKPHARELRELELRRKSMEREYLEPALEYLRRGVGEGGEAPVYGEALLAYFEGDWDTALAKARSAFAGQPWSYECKQLEGEVHAALARERTMEGDPDGATNAFRAAEAAFEEASRVGSSDAGVYLALGSLYQRVMDAEVGNRGHDVQPYFDKGLEAVTRCLTVDPENADAFLLRAALHRRMGEYRLNRGEDPTENFLASATAAAKSLELRTRAAALIEQGSTYRQIAKYEQHRGGDPGPSFAKAARAFEEARRIDPGSVSNSSIGLLLHSQARWLLDRGDDPRETLTKAIEALRAGLERDSLDVGLFNNLGNAYSTLGTYQDQIGQDPTEAQERAVEAFRAGLSVNPNQAVVLYGLGLALNQRASQVLEQGGDPATYLDEAVQAYSQAIEINPESAYLAFFHDGLGFAYSLQARHERLHGADPSESFRRAVDEFHAAIESNPNHIYSCVNLAQLQVTRAEHELDVGRAPGPFLEDAVRWAGEALRINATYFPAHVVLVESDRLLARELVEHGADPSPRLAAARATAREALELNHGDAVLHVSLGRVCTLEARWLGQRGEDPGPAFAEAKAHIEKGIELDPDDVGGYLAMAELCRRAAAWAARTGQGATNEITEGLRMTDEALALCAGNGESLALRATLLLRQAETEPDASRMESVLGRARETLDEALRCNRHLSARFAAEAERIRELTGV